jgi:threonine dehydratase
MVTLADIRAAQQRLRGVVVRTPLLRVPGPGREIWVKPESLQPIGSFKLRGAYNKIASLSDEQRRRGVIAYSSGNHAQGVAYAARALGSKAIIVMPSNAPKLKLETTAALGAEIVPVGPGSDERKQKAEALAREHGYTLVPPYDDEAIIAGQGTMALEILEDLPAPAAVLVQVGGGGMVSGVATGIKALRAETKVFGCESELNAKGKASQAKGERVFFSAEESSRTIADGMRTQSVGERPFEHIQRFVDGFISVTEEEIREGVRRVIADLHLVPEPSGAVTYAAARFHERELPAGPLVCILSGGNVDPHVLREILCG